MLPPNLWLWVGPLTFLLLAQREAGRRRGAPARIRLSRTLSLAIDVATVAYLLAAAAAATPVSPSRSGSMALGPLLAPPLFWATYVLCLAHLLQGPRRTELSLRLSLLGAVGVAAVVAHASPAFEPAAGAVATALMVLLLWESIGGIGFD